MPIRPPVLDDRSYDDLVEELLARIPAHTPDWTHPRPGDPGRTVVELFAWLADTLLYRVNLIPERQRLAFLRLLGVPMRPAVAAHGLVTLTLADKESTAALAIRALAGLPKPMHFETRSEITVLPVTAEAFAKRPLTPEEQTRFSSVLPGLQKIYGVAQATPYITTPVFVGGAADPIGFDPADHRAVTIDGCLWLALLTLKEAPGDAFITQVRTALAGQLLNVGLAPAISVPALAETIGPRPAIPFRWEISYVADEKRNIVDYVTLDVVPGTDTTAGLTQRGTMRLVLPAAEFIGAPSNDVRRALTAGVADRPPRLDDPKEQARLVAWLRLRPGAAGPSGAAVNLPALSWAGANAVEIDQRKTITGRVVGESDGAADQELQLPGRSVEAESLRIEVAEEGQAYRTWQRVEDLAVAGRDTLAFVLDSEAGTIRFGDNVRGRIPPLGARIRVGMMRSGGGLAGNLPPGSLTAIEATPIGGGSAAGKLKVQQGLATEGGDDAETLAQAEQRIPALFRHRNRAVTAEDYRQLAAVTPGVRLGRVEVLPRFKPQQRRLNVPGVVSVLVLPTQADTTPPNPRPDRSLLEAVFAYLDARRPLTTEMYVIGCEYVALGAGISITVREDYGRQEVIQAVQDAVRAFLWPLLPGGAEGAGWPLGGTVRDREVEVVVARVPGVQMVNGVNLFHTADGKTPTADSPWLLLQPAQSNAPAELTLSAWQLPELLTLSVEAETGVAPDLARLGTAGVGTGTGTGAGGVAVPVVPEVC